MTPLQTVFRHPFRRYSDCLQTASHTLPLIPPDRLKASEGSPLREDPAAISRKVERRNSGNDRPRLLQPRAGTRAALRHLVRSPAAFGAEEGQGPTVRRPSKASDEEPSRREAPLSNAPFWELR